MSRGRQIPIDVDREIAALVRAGYGPAQISRHLEQGPNAGEVSEKTVQRRVRDLRPGDSSGPWSAADADPEEARLVLDVVAEVFFSTAGRVWPTKNHVAEIARLRKTAPSIPPLWADNLARAYRLCKEQRRDSRHLDLALALRPWEGPEGADQMAQALGLPRSFRVEDDVSGPLFAADAVVMLFELVTFQGLVEDMGLRLESASTSDAIPEPTEVIVVDVMGRPLEGAAQNSTTPVTTPMPPDEPGQT
jgi:hypothetical protein